MQFFLDTIKTAQESGLLRNTIMYTRYKHDYSSNSYLGLVNAIKAKIIMLWCVMRYGLGLNASKYVNGYSFVHKKLEEAVSYYYKKDSALIFGSGYMASIGVLQGVCCTKSLIIADKFIHASWLDGAKATNTRIIRYIHNNLEHLDEILAKQSKQYERIIIVTEAVFSMHGTVIDIEKYITIAQKYQAVLITDHAHSLGVIKQEYTQYNLHVITGTFSKACSGFGGYVCGAKAIIQVIANFGRTQIYSTCLPNYLLAYNLWAFGYAVKNTGAMLTNAQKIAKQYGLKFNGSAILIKEFESLEDAYSFQKSLIKHSVYAPVIRKPTVPKTIVRFCVKA